MGAQNNDQIQGSKQSPPLEICTKICSSLQPYRKGWRSGRKLRKGKKQKKQKNIQCKMTQSSALIWDISHNPPSQRVY